MIEGYLNSLHNGERPALFIDGVSWSYNQLHDLALRVAAEAKRSSSDFVGLYTDNNVYTYASLLGILMAGKGFVPLNSKFPNTRLASVADDARLTMVVCCNSSRTNIHQFAKDVEIVAADTLPEQKTEVVTEGKGYILYTSGSTGVPKGIPITRNNFRALAAALNQHIKINERDRVLQAFELSFDVSLACCFMAWDNGAQLVVADLNGITAVNAFKAAYEQKCTIVTLPPSALFYLKRLKIIGSVVLDEVHTTLFTGEALQFALTEDWKKCAPNSSIQNAYGPTETTVWCLFYLLDQTTREQLINGLCPIGNVLNGLHYRIVDESGQDVPDETRGELVVGGEQIFHGYSNHPDKTKEVLYSSPDNIRWYRTGDIVVKNKSGNIVYVNRKDNQVQVNGFRVELGEVEFALRQACGTDSAVVIAIERNNVTELIAFIEGKVDKSNVIEKLTAQVPHYMIPREFNSVSVLPINNSGKIDKLKLKEQYLS